MSALKYTSVFLSVVAICAAGYAVVSMNSVDTDAARRQLETHTSLVQAKERPGNVNSDSYGVEESMIKIPALDDLENSLGHLTSEVTDLEARADATDEGFEEQYAKNQQFDDDLEALNKEFDDVLKFRVSRHVIDMYEGQDPLKLGFDVTLDVAPTADLELEISFKGHQSVKTSAPRGLKWAKGATTHEVVSVHIGWALIGEIRTEILVGTFKSADKHFDGKAFDVYINISPACATENGGCEHACHDGMKHHHCSCRPGYSLDDDKHGCTNIDECETKTDDCHADATCHDTDGSFTCSCNDGYRGEGHGKEAGCADIDECAEGTDSSCGDNTTCENTKGSYKCNCNKGYRPNDETKESPYPVCVDIDECAEETDTCDDHSQCYNRPGTFACRCHPGWAPDEPYNKNPQTHCHSYGEDWVKGGKEGIFAFRNGRSWHCLHSTLPSGTILQHPCDVLLKENGPNYINSHVVWKWNNNRIEGHEKHAEHEEARCISMHKYWKPPKDDKPVAIDDTAGWTFDDSFGGDDGGDWGSWRRRLSAEEDDEIDFESTEAWEAAVAADASNEVTRRKLNVVSREVFEIRTAHDSCALAEEWQYKFAYNPKNYMITYNGHKALQHIDLAEITATEPCKQSDSQTVNDCPPKKGFEWAVFTRRDLLRAVGYRPPSNPQA